MITHCKQGALVALRRPLSARLAITTPQRVTSRLLLAATAAQRRAYATRDDNRLVAPPPDYGDEYQRNGFEVEDKRKPMHAADGKRVAIIGGGLTGLTAAYYLSLRTRGTAKITIYDANDRLGGWIQTDKIKVDVNGVKGTVNFERGPRSLSGLATSTSRFDDLVLYDMCARLGLTPKAAPTDLKRLIYYPDHLVQVPPPLSWNPMSLVKLWSEPLYRQVVVALWGVAKWMFGDRAMPYDPNHELGDHSVTDYVKVVTGSQAAADNAASAVFGGIYGGDIDKIDAWTALYPRYEEEKFRYLMGDPKHRRCQSFPEGIKNPRAGMGIATRDDDLVRGSITAEHRRHPDFFKVLQDTQYQQPKPPSLIHFGGEGLQSLTDALTVAIAAQPNVEIKASTPVQGLVHSEEQKEIKLQEPSGAQATYDQVISTVGAETLSNMTGSNLPVLNDLKTVSIMTVNIWYPYKDLKPRGLGYLIPKSVDPSLNPEHALGVFFDSDIENSLPNEPEGTKLFVLMGGYHYDKPGVKIPTEAEAIQQAKSLLERHLHIPADLPCHAEAKFQKDCIPQHNIGHRTRMKKLAKEAQSAYGGRLGLYGGTFTRIGALAALRDGYLAAEKGTQVGMDEWMPWGGLRYFVQPAHRVTSRGDAAQVRPRLFKRMTDKRYVREVVKG